MKKNATLLSVLAAAVLMGAPPVRAQQEVNFDFFYTSLKDGGEWLQSEKYGYVFQPRVAVEKANWKPYSDGYWGETDQGWAWVSNEDFGWATYHYGRWAKLAETGWVWVPGYEWAASWVSWRSSPKASGRGGAPALVSGRGGPARRSSGSGRTEYIGWAPLPPEAAFDYDTGFASSVEVTYDIGPANYNFVPVESFCSPTLVTVIRPSYDNFDYFSDTVNCTNTVYVGRGSYIYAGGPNYTYLSGFQARPIPRLVIAPQTVQGASFSNAVVGNEFRVFAPRVAPPAGILVGASGIPVTVAAAPALGRPVAIAGPTQTGWDVTGTKVNPATAAQIRDNTRVQAARGPSVAIRPAVVKPPANPVPIRPPDPATTGRPPGAGAPLGGQPPVSTAPLGSQRPPVAGAPLVPMSPPVSTAPLGSQRPPVAGAPLAPIRPPTSTAPLGSQPPVSTAPLGSQRPPVSSIPLAPTRPPVTTAPGSLRPLVTGVPQTPTRPPVNAGPADGFRPPVTKVPSDAVRPPVTKVPSEAVRPPVTRIPPDVVRPPVKKVPSDVVRAPVNAPIAPTRPSVQAPVKPVKPVVQPRPAAEPRPTPVRQVVERKPAPTRPPQVQQTPRPQVQAAPRPQVQPTPRPQVQQAPRPQVQTPRPQVQAPRPTPPPKAAAPAATPDPKKKPVPPDQQR